MHLNKRYCRAIALYAVFVISFLLYLPAVNGPYLLDDHPNLVQNENLILEGFDLESIGKAAMSSNSSFMGRPLSMLSFSLNYTLAGNKDPFSVKFTNILLHLITGTGVFILLKLILAHWLPQNKDKVFWIALFTTAIWLMHPLHISTVLYAVQRMTILSALCTIFGLISYVRYRQKTIQTNSHFLTLLITVSGFTLLGVLSKENAILTPIFALLIELSIFRFRFHPQTTTVNRLLVKSLLYVPTLMVFAYLTFTYFNIRGEIIRPYFLTIDQRLLTETRMIIHYLGWITLLNPDPMSLFHTDIKLSTSLLNPVTTLFSIVALALLVILAIISLLKKCYPVLGFGILWFFTGHLLESTSIPLKLVFEHRNYLPSIGFLLIPAFFLVHSLENFSSNPLRRDFFCLLIVFITAFLCHERVNAWSNQKSFILNLVTKKPEISWAWSEAANFLSQTGNFVPAIESVRTAARLEPTEPAFIFGEANIRCRLQPDAKFPEDFKSRLSTALDNPITPTSINSFVNMINICHTTNMNDAVLRRLYIEATGNDMNIIANIGKQALAHLDAKPVRN